MSGSNYAHCDHCGTKAFYDADTEIGDAAIFHGECLTKHYAAVAAKALRDAAGRVRQMHDAATPRGIAAALMVDATRIEREAGESDADA